jgi:pimeloyl-[acyl-carrier protein] methyl ester esterase
MKPGVLILSGWAFPPAAWASVLRRLEPAWEVRVIPSEALLTGQVEGPDDVAARIRAQLPAGRPCLLAGWSLGAMLALEAAPALAEALGGVLLISATARFCRDPDQDGGIPEAAVRAMALGLRADPERTLERFYVTTASPAEPDPDDLGRWTTACLADRPGLEAGLAYLRRADLRGRASCGGAPAVLLHGRDDAIIPCDAGRALAARLRPSRIELYEDVGHDLPLRRPDVVVKGLHSLLRMCG